MKDPIIDQLLKRFPPATMREIADLLSQRSYLLHGLAKVDEQLNALLDTPHTCARCLSQAVPGDETMPTVNCPICGEDFTPGPTDVIGDDKQVYHAQCWAKKHEPSVEAVFGYGEDAEPSEVDEE